MPRVFALSLLLLPLATLAATPTAAPERSVELRSEGEQLPASADGRYQVRAVVELTDSTHAPGGGYRLKSTAATCEPLTDQLFDDGFE